MRTFIALELPELFEDEVTALARQLRDVVDGRFMRRETYHVTLAFLGEVDEMGVHDAMAALDETCAGRAAVELVPDGLGTFGRPRDATLWLGLRPVPELLALAGDVRVALDAYGVAYDRKAFRPHITLARRARMPRGELPTLVFPESGQATCVTLFKSELSSEGATYKPLYTIELAS
ncbi:RNA 2',3'-cyclic phosphodiesterase [uncultured Enorma sp.]|uniref:RNA 2',3'-cyclic phosphodiesterase n=1 Tax=uncultured Enorma sp. TaxID=1714346 RepID=UPI002805C5EB|nr:RNA 2',3'-cyclic phosphodiesterase [uncultured Enorma sp.]